MSASRPPPGDPYDDVMFRVLMLAVLGVVLAMPTTFLFMVLGQLSGHSGTTGTEYVGYLDVAEAREYCFFGLPFGLATGPLAYLMFRPRCPFPRLVAAMLLGTLIGGCTGALAGGFWLAILPAAVGCAAGSALASRLWTSDQAKPGGGVAF